MAITPVEIAAALGRPTPDADSIEWRQWELWISDARMLIETRLGDLDSLDQAKLDYVVREAVVALVRRPDDATTVDVSVDDGRVSRRFSSGSGRIRILDEWWDLLDPDGASRESEAYAVDTYAGVDMRHGHSQTCNIFFGSPTCSCGAYLTLGRFPLYDYDLPL